MSVNTNGQKTYYFAGRTVSRLHFEHYPKLFIKKIFVNKGLQKEKKFADNYHVRSDITDLLETHLFQTVCYKKVHELRQLLLAYIKNLAIANFHSIAPGRRSVT